MVIKFSLTCDDANSAHDLCETLERFDLNAVVNYQPNSPVRGREVIIESIDDGDTSLWVAQKITEAVGLLFSTN